MLPNTKKDRIRLIIAILLLSASAGVVAWLLATGKFDHVTSWIFQLFSDKSQLREYIRSWGAWAPAVFISIQVLQVLIAPIPGELTGVVGGFIFGTGWATILSSIGLTVGSILAFTAARIIGRPFVNLVLKKQTLEKFQEFTTKKGTVPIMICFMIPGFPKDILSYILGLSPMRFMTFAFVCAIGRIPGTFFLGFSGAAIYRENWTVVIVIGVLAASVIILSYFKQDSIRRWVHEKRDHRPPD